MHKHDQKRKFTLKIYLMSKMQLLYSSVQTQG